MAAGGAEAHSGVTIHPTQRITMDDIRSAFARQGLVRARDGRILGGVCAGIGRRFGLTPGVSRIIFVVLLMVLPGSQLLVYPLLWFLMPDEESIERAATGTPDDGGGA